MGSTVLPTAGSVAASATLPEGSVIASTWPKPTHGSDPDISAPSRLKKRGSYRTQYEDHVFCALPKYIGEFDAWPSYSIFIWIPMLLHIYKLLFIMLLLSQVLKITHLIGFTCFISWALAETLMIIAARRKLTEHEVPAALILGRSWRTVIRDVIEPKFDKTWQLRTITGTCKRGFLL
jgi:hypothetical protein